MNLKKCEVYLPAGVNSDMLQLPVRRVARPRKPCGTTSATHLRESTRAKLGAEPRRAPSRTSRGCCVRSAIRCLQEGRATWRSATNKSASRPRTGSTVPATFSTCRLAHSFMQESTGIRPSEVTTRRCKPHELPAAHHGMATVTTAPSAADHTQAGLESRLRCATEQTRTPRNVREQSNTLSLTASRPSPPSRKVFDCACRNVASHRSTSRCGAVCTNFRKASNTAGDAARLSARSSHTR